MTFLYRFLTFLQLTMNVYFYLLRLLIYGRAYMCYGAHMGVRRQLGGVSSLLLLYEHCPPNSSQQADSKHPYLLAWKCMFETPGSAITLINQKVLLLLYFSGNSGRGAKQACLKCKIWEARQW